MKEITITDEYLAKFEDDIEFDTSHFKTENKIEVRIPFTGYYTLTIPCDDPQIAIVEVLKVNRDVGIMSLVGGDYKIESVEEDETYAVMEEK